MNPYLLKYISKTVNLIFLLNFIILHPFYFQLVLTDIFFKYPLFAVLSLIKNKKVSQLARRQTRQNVYDNLINKIINKMSFSFFKLKASLILTLKNI